MDTRLGRSIFFVYSLLFLITPLLMFHKTSELFEFNKLLFVYAATTIIGCLWLLRMVLRRKIVFTNTFFTVPLLLFLASQIISTFFSIDVHTSIFGYYGRFNGGLLSIISYIILYFAFVSNITSFTREEVISLCKRFIAISLVTSSIVILWALPGKFGYDLTCLLFTGRLNVSCWTAQFDPTARMFSTLGQPNWLGAYLAITFFFGLFIWQQLKQGTRNWILMTAYLALNFSAILFTRSRSTLAAVIVGLGLFTLNQIKKDSGKIRLIQLLILFIIPFFIFKTGIPSVDNYLSFHQAKPARVTSLQSTSSANGVTESFDIRKIVWKGAFKLGMKYSLFGTGVETFAYSYYFVRPLEHNVTSEWDFIYNKAHNEYLNYFATTGSVGLLTYLVMIGAFLWFVAASRRGKKGNETDLVFALAISYITILITNFFGFSTTVISLYFYLIPAIVVALLLPAKAFVPVETSKLETTSQKVLFLVPIVVSLFALAYLLAYFIADINYAYGDNYQAVQEYDTAQGYFLQALALRKEHVYQDKLAQAIASSAFLNSGQKISKDILVQQVALSDYYSKQALAASPENILYWRNRAKNYFLFYQAFGNESYFNEAIKALDKAKHIAPTDPKTYYTEGLFYSTKLDQKLSSIDKDAVVKRVMENIDMAIKLKPNYREAYSLKALLH